MGHPYHLSCPTFSQTIFPLILCELFSTGCLTSFISLCLLTFFFFNLIFCDLLHSCIPPLSSSFPFYFDPFLRPFSFNVDLHCPSPLSPQTLSLTCFFIFPFHWASLTSLLTFFLVFSDFSPTFCSPPWSSLLSRLTSFFLSFSSVLHCLSPCLSPLPFSLIFWNTELHNGKI